MHDPQHDAPRRPGRHGPDGQQGHRNAGASRASSTSSRRTTSPWRRRSTWSISRPGRRSRGRSSTSSRTKRCCWNWPWSSTRCSTLLEEGYTPIITPDVARVEVLEGIGFIPRPNPETQIYTIADTDLCLIATAEITLGGMHRDQILDELQLPLKYVGLSHCFRTEAGAPGRDTRGLYRVHQFTKVEMFAFCTPEQSEAIHQELLRIEEEIFQGLGLPYHVIDTCTGDLGGPAYRKYDLEAWMPGRGEGGEYGEVTSTSNCTDYQARRLNIRYKKPGQKGTRFVHTLNGTAVAVSRAFWRILENYQQADGSVVGAGGAAAVGRQGPDRKAFIMDISAAMFSREGSVSDAMRAPSQRARVAAPPLAAKNRMAALQSSTHSDNSSSVSGL